MSQLIEQKPEAAERRETRVEYSTPGVNLRHDAEGFTLEVEMPGVAKNGVDITFDDGKLTLVGHRSQRPESGNRLHGESLARDYRRVFDLDPSIDPDRITASLNQGLLTVRLSKVEAAKPRKIAVG
jgi:HSP20 family protein